MKQVRISDEAYNIITREAKVEHRSVFADQLDAMILKSTELDTLKMLVEIDPSAVAEAVQDLAPNPTPLEVTKEAVEEDEMPKDFKETIKLCKHGSARGLCKMGCK